MVEKCRQRTYKPAVGWLRVITLTLAVMPMTACTTTQPSADDARNVLRQRLDHGNEARLRLASFEKTDGRSMEFMGVKAYELMFAATAEFTQDALFTVAGPSTVFGTSVDGTVAEITTTEYRARTGDFMQDFSLDFNKLRPVRAGDALRLSGHVAFERRESGWVATGTRFTSTVDYKAGQALLGEWSGRMADYEGRLIDKEATIRVTVARDDAKFRVVFTNLIDNGESVFAAGLRDGVLQVEGRPRDFYKGHVPTIKLDDKAGSAWWSDGIGNFHLTRK